jgi:hypothetical protein
VNMSMGPPSGGDLFGFVVVAAGALATAASFFLAARATFRPGEREPGHPKNLILRDDR